MFSLKGRFKKARKSAHSILGAITLLCGFILMWASVGGGRGNIQTIDGSLGTAVTIDPLKPHAQHNGAPVVAAGRWVSTEQLEDDFVKAAPLLIFRRRVEMYQWAERIHPVTKAVEYRLGWHEGQIDFFKFQQQQGHENPLLRIPPLEKRVVVSNFGSFDGSALIQRVKHLLPLQLSRDMLKNSSMTIEDNKIVIRRDPAATLVGLGDIRIWYEALPQGDYTFFGRQVDERTLVDGRSDEDVFIRQGLWSRETLRDASIDEVNQASTGMAYAGTILLFCGLVSVMLPFAGALNLRPHVPIQGPTAVVLVSAAIALLTLLIILILGAIA